MRPHQVNWLLGLLLLWALAVRLLFGWPNPSMNRLWDERYNAGNVAAILAEGQWRPVRAHYPTLSYLPHVAVLKTYEAGRGLTALSSTPRTFGTAPDRRPFLTPFAIRVCRVIQALLGTASLFVVFLIGKRLFGPWIGLGAAFVLSVAPWHLRHSGFFKPDIMLVLTSVLALHAMLHARRSETLRGYAVAGALVGATAAAKWNGAALVLPLIVTIALGGFRSPGLLLRRIGAAGAATTVVLVALNPWLVLSPGLYRRHLGSTVNHYQERLDEVGADLFDQPLNLIASLAGSVYFGPVLGTCGLLGLTAMLTLALRAKARVGVALPGTAGTAGKATMADAWILLTFFGGYVGALWAVTRYPKPPNWLIVATPAALAAVWLIGGLVAAARSAPHGFVRWTASVSLAALLGLASAAKIDFIHRAVYTENVALTSAQAARLAGGREPLRGRTFITELALGHQDFDPRVWDGNYVSTLIRASDIASISALERGAADILLFPASRLEPSEAPVYRELATEEHGTEVERFDPKLFRLRGDPVVLVRQRFLPIGQPESVPVVAVGEGIYEVELPGLIAPAGSSVPSAPGGYPPAAELSGDPTSLTPGDDDRELLSAAFVSLEIAIRTPSRDIVEVTVDAGGERLPCRLTQKGRQRRRCLTPRVPEPAIPIRVRIDPAREIDVVTAFRWRRPN